MKLESWNPEFLYVHGGMFNVPVRELGFPFQPVTVGFISDESLGNEPCGIPNVGLLNENDILLTHSKRMVEGDAGIPPTTI